MEFSGALLTSIDTATAYFPAHNTALLKSISSMFFKHLLSTLQTKYMRAIFTHKDFSISGIKPVALSKTLLLSQYFHIVTEIGRDLGLSVTLD